MEPPRKSSVSAPGPGPPAGPWSPPATDPETLSRRRPRGQWPGRAAGAFTHFSATGVRSDHLVGTQHPGGKHHRGVRPHSYPARRGPRRHPSRPGAAAAASHRACAHQPARQVPAIVAVDLAEQAPQVGQRAAAWLGPTKPISDPGVQSVQLPNPLDLSRIGVWHLSTRPPEVGERRAHYPNRTAAVGVTGAAGGEHPSGLWPTRAVRGRWRGIPAAGWHRWRTPATSVEGGVVRAGMVDWRDAGGSDENCGTKLYERVGA